MLSKQKSYHSLRASFEPAQIACSDIVTFVEARHVFSCQEGWLCGSPHVFIWMLLIVSVSQNLPSNALSIQSSIDPFSNDWFGHLTTSFSWFDLSTINKICAAWMTVRRSAGISCCSCLQQIDLETNTMIQAISRLVLFVILTLLVKLRRIRRKRILRFWWIK